MYLDLWYLHLECNLWCLELLVLNPDEAENWVTSVNGTSLCFAGVSVSVMLFASWMFHSLTTGRVCSGGSLSTQPEGQAPLRLTAGRPGQQVIANFTGPAPNKQALFSNADSKSKPLSPHPTLFETVPSPSSPAPPPPLLLGRLSYWRLNLLCFLISYLLLPGTALCHLSWYWRVWCPLLLLVRCSFCPVTRTCGMPFVLPHVRALCHLSCHTYVRCAICPATHMRVMPFVPLPLGYTCCPVCPLGACYAFCPNIRTLWLLSSYL